MSEGGQNLARKQQVASQRIERIDDICCCSSEIVIAILMDFLANAAKQETTAVTQAKGNSHQFTQFEKSSDDDWTNQRFSKNFTIISTWHLYFEKKIVLWIWILDRFLGFYYWRFDTLSLFQCKDRQKVDIKIRISKERWIVSSFIKRRGINLHVC